MEPLCQQLDATLVLRESGLGSQMRTSRSLHMSASAGLCHLLWLCVAVSWTRIFACLLRLHRSCFLRCLHPLPRKGGGDLFEGRYHRTRTWFARLALFSLLPQFHLKLPIHS